MCQSSFEGVNSTSYYQSQLTEESFQQAEHNAMAHEEMARKKRFDKEQKLIEFQNKTKANAMRKLRDDKEQKLKDQNTKAFKAKENALKAKEYAQK